MRKSVTSQAQKPIVPEHEVLRDLLELYASKADELIAGAKGRRQKALRLDRADALRSARESLKAGRAGEFVRFASSRQALPIARRVARNTNAISHLEKLPEATRLELCKAFARALEAERRADDKLVKSGEITREPGVCSILDYKLAKLRRVQSGLGAGKAV